MRWGTRRLRGGWSDEGVWELAHVGLLDVLDVSSGLSSRMFPSLAHQSAGCKPLRGREEVGRLRPSSGCCLLHYFVRGRRSFYRAGRKPPAALQERLRAVFGF